MAEKFEHGELLEYKSGFLEDQELLGVAARTNHDLDIKVKFLVFVTLERYRNLRGRLLWVDSQGI